MTAATSFSEYMSVAMTTKTIDDVTRTVATSTSTSRGANFYLQCAVLVIGVVGTAANALILYALVASKQHEKHVLIFNQNVIDCISSVLLVITYAVKLCNIYLTGLGGYWICMLLLSENIVWCAILASKANLIFVTIERYLKAVYPICSKKRLRKWMIYSSTAFAWISGFVHTVILTFFTTNVIDGVCYSYVVWKTRESQKAFGIWYFFTYYVIEIVIFIYCYWHILAIIRRQASVMASHGNRVSSTAQAKNHQIQSNIVKPMIIKITRFSLKLSNK